MYSAQSFLMCINHFRSAGSETVNLMLYLLVLWWIMAAVFELSPLSELCARCWLCVSRSSAVARGRERRRGGYNTWVWQWSTATDRCNHCRWVAFSFDNKYIKIDGRLVPLHRQVSQERNYYLEFSSSFSLNCLCLYSFVYLYPHWEMCFANSVILNLSLTLRKNKVMLHILYVILSLMMHFNHKDNLGLSRWHWLLWWGCFQLAKDQIRQHKSLFTFHIHICTRNYVKKHISVVKCEFYQMGS